MARQLRNALVTLSWVALCTAGGLSLLPRTQPWRSFCGYAGRHHRTFNHKNNSAAYLEYGRRMRTGFAYQARDMCAQNADLIKKFKRGDYFNQRDEFDADTASFSDSLLESITLFDGQQVPDVLAKSHAKIAHCHRLCYESVQALREAYGAKGYEQARLVKEAEKRWKEAWLTGNAGVKLHNEIWARTTT